MSKSLADTSKAFTGSAGKASTAYGLAIPTADAITPGTSPQAQTNYVNAMTNPNILAKRLTNLQKVTVAQWRAQALAKGVPNISVGIANAGAKYTANFGPSYDIIAAFQLQPKTSDSDTNIDNNLKPLARQLQALSRGQAS